MKKEPFYPKEARKQIEQEFHLFETDKTKITEITKLLWQIIPTNDPRKPIYKLAHLGLLLRLKILDRCVENVFHIHPIDLNRILTRHELLDSWINQISFLFNLYAVLETIFEIYAISIDFKGKKYNKSFFSGNKRTNNALLETLPKHIQKEFHPENEWIKYIKAARNYLAHREPFYIAPQTIDKNGLKTWDNMEMQKSRINRAFWEKMHIKLNNPDEIRASKEELEAERNAKVLEIQRKQLEYMFSHPAINVDIKNRQDPWVKVHLPMLRDVRMIHDRILLILNHIAKHKLKIP